MLMGGIIADVTIQTIEEARKDRCIPECNHKNCANCQIGSFI